MAMHRTDELYSQLFTAMKSALFCRAEQKNKVDIKTINHQSIHS